MSSVTFRAFWASTRCCRVALLSPGKQRWFVLFVSGCEGLSLQRIICTLCWCVLEALRYLDAVPVDRLMTAALTRRWMDPPQTTLNHLKNAAPGTPRPAISCMSLPPLRFSGRAVARVAAQAESEREAKETAADTKREAHAEAEAEEARLAWRQQEQQEQGQRERAAATAAGAAMSGNGGGAGSGGGGEVGATETVASLEDRLKKAIDRGVSVCSCVRLFRWCPAAATSGFRWIHDVITCFGLADGNSIAAANTYCQQQNNECGYTNYHGEQ